jgi:hypothetical protein
MVVELCIIELSELPELLPESLSLPQATTPRERAAAAPTAPAILRGFLRMGLLLASGLEWG